MKTILLLLLCISTTTYAEVYKWVDKDGKTHYGDRPSSSQAKEIKIQEPSSPSGPSKETRQNQKAIDDWLKARDIDREENNKKEAVLKQERARQKQACNELKIELADMEKGGVVWYDIDDKGQRRFYSDKEIAQQIEELRKTIKHNCR